MRWEQRSNCGVVKNHMTTTAQFNTNILYPGGQAECGVIVHDPYPSGIPNGNIFKTNVSMANVQKYIYNLEVWDVDFDVAASVDSGAIAATHAIDGQFHRTSLSVGYPSGADDVNGYGEVFQGEPYENVCGDTYRTTRVYDGLGTDTTTHSENTADPIIPRCTMNYGTPGVVGDDPTGVTVTGSFNIEDGSSNVVGDVNFSRYLNSTGSAGDVVYSTGFVPLYVRLLGDGTADVYFRFSTFLWNNVFGDLLILQNNNTSSPGPTYPATAASPGDNNENGTATSVSFTVFGNSVSGYLWHRGTYDFVDTYATSTFTSFSGSLSITVTTAYTY